jgi:integrase
MVLVALRSLLRLGALLKLKWKHVDVQGRKIHLAEAETKAGAEVAVPVGEDLLEALGLPGRPEDLVFRTAPRHHQTVAAAFARAVKRAGVPRLTFHDLRKSAATQLLDAGVPIQVVQALGGWKRPDVLLKHYAQVTQKGAQRAADILKAFASAT